MGFKSWLLGRGPGKSRYEIGGSDPYTAGLQSAMYERAMGTAPSAAELMMDRGMQQQIAAGRSMAASMPGVSPGLAMRMAGQREAGAMADVGQQTAILRAQEQAQAQEALARYLQEQDRMKLQQEMYNQARKARSGMLGSILGTAGTIGGAMIAGPAGAAAGGQIGQGIGQGIGGGAGYAEGYGPGGQAIGWEAKGW